jgi:hypothetical protein
MSIFGLSKQYKETMKKVVLLVTTFLLSYTFVNSQTNVYSISSGELLFQWGEMEFTDAYKEANPDNELLVSPMRFTMFFHLGYNLHVDFSDKFGIYSGFGLRNVGLISNERIKDANDVIQDYKFVRRSYNLGVPFALKLGSFENNTYFFVGGELELQFAYKEKYWNSHDRSGSKSKNDEWFGDQTNTLLPSAFLGFQFPYGLNVKFKYYLDDFLNHDYKKPNNPLSDLTRYETSQLMYFSLSWQFENDKLKKKSSSSTTTTAK